MHICMCAGIYIYVFHFNCLSPECKISPLEEKYPITKSAVLYVLR